MIKQAFKIPILLMLAFVAACSNTKTSENDSESFPTKPLNWSKNAIIYEVNIRQYTPEGTIAAFSQELPKLKKLGVDILWLMPIFPIGEENRKGGMGSPYAVKDYRAVNPDFGSIDDLNHLVKQAHDLDMYVILDWVANHTAWDNPLTIEHPDWYVKDSLGNFTPPVPDWADVIHLDYSKQDLRKYMVNSMKFWVEESDVDGFRCDVAMMVPTDFWEDARAELDSIKPMFMLAEAEQPDHLEKAFDMNYGWELHHIMNEIAKGKMNVTNLDGYFKKYDTLYNADDYRMNFTSNHDENSWNGTVTERMGEASEAMAVFSYLVPGMPLIYSGQEAGLDKRLAFFEKDSINWVDSEWRELYTSLNQLKKDNKALWNGAFGSPMKRINTSNDESVFAIERNLDDNHVIALFNMSNTDQEITISNKLNEVSRENYFTGETITLKEGSTISLNPWEYLILIKQ